MLHAGTHPLDPPEKQATRLSELLLFFRNSPICREKAH
jgi:hypothetical protein